MTRIQFTNYPYENSSEKAPLHESGQGQHLGDLKRQLSGPHRSLRDFIRIGKDEGDSEARTLLPFHHAVHTEERRKIRKWIVVILAVFTALAYTRSIIYRVDRPPTTDSTHLRNPAYLIEAANGAAATENEVCSVIGVDVMKDGGNAVDAAIASTFCIGVVNLFS